MLGEFRFEPALSAIRSGSVSMIPGYCISLSAQACVIVPPFHVFNSRTDGDAANLPFLNAPEMPEAKTYVLRAMTVTTQSDSTGKERPE